MTLTKHYVIEAKSLVEAEAIAEDQALYDNPGTRCVSAKASRLGRDSYSVMVKLVTR